jgi:hypothetical protein
MNIRTYYVNTYDDAFGDRCQIEKAYTAEDAVFQIKTRMGSSNCTITGVYPPHVINPLTDNWRNQAYELVSQAGNEIGKTPKFFQLRAKADTLLHCADELDQSLKVK